MKKMFFYLAMSVSLLLNFTSCDIGLGNEVDLVAPEITVTSPENLGHVHREVTFTGTCIDNIGITEVLVSNATTGEIYGKATINGNIWTKTLYLDEGEVEIKIVAKDKAGNTSIKSSAVIFLLVDETAPEGLSWYVDRGDGVQVSLMDKETLEGIVIEDSEEKHISPVLAKNKHIPQNEKFTVHGRFYDAMSIDTITLSLSENGTEILSKKVQATEYEKGGDGESIYAPAFTFTHDELVAANSSLATGPHYLQVSYYSTDDNKNNSSRILSYLLWYPETDIPGIQQSNTLNEMLAISVGGSIPVHFFDDDELSEIAYDFIAEENYKTGSWTDDNVSEKKDALKNKMIGSELAGRGDMPLQVNAGETTGIYYLIAYVKDIRGKERSRIIRTAVSDASNPLLIVEEPSENAVPSMIAGTNNFEIKGYGYDTSGSRQVRIVYVPGNLTYNTPAKREERAKALLEDKNIYDDSIVDLTGIGGKICETGEIVKTYEFPVVKSKDPADQWYREEFNFKFDVLNDFGAESNRTKFFELYLEDTDGNKVYKQFNIAGDTSAPEINIKSPAENMVVCDYRHQNLVLKFKASKSSNLGIDVSKYRVVRRGYAGETGDSTPSFIKTVGDGLTIDDEGFASVTIAKETLKDWAEGLNGYTADVQPIFTFYAEDVLGNHSSDQRTVVLSPLPVLEKITSEKISNTYPVGTTFTFQAKFSDSVKVTGTPRLKLGGISPAGEYYATYSGGTGTDTLSFIYTSIEGKNTATNESFSVMGDSIDLNDGSIVTGTAGTGNATIAYVDGANFWDSTDVDVKRELKLDGVKPYITGLTSSVDGLTRNVDGNYYVNVNREIVIDVEFSEAVFVSENPTLSANGISFNFQSMDGTHVKFSHKVASEENVSNLRFNLSNCISDTSKIKDAAGNSMKTGSGEKDPKVVIDTMAPGIPSVSGVTSGICNIHPTLVLTRASGDTDSTLEYSLNGGLSWNTYTVPYSISQTGLHIITSRATDKAGNVSPHSSNIEITINDTFPAVDEISIAKTDGKYKFGETVDFKVFLSDVVEPFDNTAYIKFADSTGNNETTVHVTPSEVQTNKLVFTYTVDSTSDFKGVKITEANLANIQDKYENKASDETTAKINTLLIGSSCNRTNLILDGVSPTVASYQLGSDISYTYPSSGIIEASDEKVSSSQNNAFTITLKFNENLVKESGKIILQRKGKWAIPPVLDSLKFSKYYNVMSIADREKMMITEGGNGEGVEKLDDKTGMPIGPYQKITHGLKDSGGKAVPDTATKYVLAFKYGLYEDLPGESTVSDIREALKTIGYDKHTLEVNTGNVTLSASDSNHTSDVLTLTFSDVIEDGQEWELLIPANSFHDETGNYFSGFKSNTDTDAGKKCFALWSNNVAQPVVRVNRYSHGLGAYGVNSSGIKTEITGWTRWNETSYARNSGSNLKPLGYAEVRIDCETPNASIYYKEISGETAVYTTHEFENGQKNEDESHKSDIQDIKITDLKLTSGGTSYSGNITVGDISDDTNRYKTARKDYVSAYAQKIGFEDSIPGFEGVYKTVILLYKNNSKNQINIEGGTAKGGEPNVSGFPLRDATNDRRYSKNAYQYTEGGKNFFAWVSYEIISKDFAVLQHRSNYSSNYPTHSYGQLLYLYNYSTWE